MWAFFGWKTLKKRQIFDVYTVQQPNTDFGLNITSAYGEDFMIFSNDMGHKDHRNRWKHFCTLENFSGQRFAFAPLFSGTPKSDNFFFSQILEFLVPLVSIVRDKHKSLWDHGSKIKPCSVSSAKSRQFSELIFDLAMQGFSLNDVIWLWRQKIRWLMKSAKFMELVSRFYWDHFCSVNFFLFRFSLE